MFTPSNIFESTKNTYSENRKAEIKNYNLPILNYMYNGDVNTNIKCVLSNTPGFLNLPDYVTNANKTRFRIDFNHIRQRYNSDARSGTSVDKNSTYGPSGIFREKLFTDRSNARYLFEFMTIMPVSTEYHSYVSQDSAKNNITLQTFNQNSWPWVLKNQSNYNNFCKIMRIEGIPYDEFIDHLSDINYPAIDQRLIYDYYTKTWALR